MMDTYEILSTIRNFSGLNTEGALDTRQLKRLCNAGMQFVGQALLPLINNFLVTTKTYADQTGSSVPVPGDALRIIDVERENSDNQMKSCTEVPVQDRSLMETNSNYPDNENHPGYIQEGRDVFIYPALSTTDVKVRYRRLIVDLAEGEATYNADTKADLGGNARPDDDVYVGYDFAIYVRDNTILTLQGIYKCTAYDGANKRVTLSGSGIFADDGTKYYYALVPIIPDEHHPFIVEAGLIQLARAGKIEKADWKADQKDLIGRLDMVRKVGGVT